MNHDDQVLEKLEIIPEDDSICMNEDKIHNDIGNETILNSSQIMA